MDQIVEYYIIRVTKDPQTEIALSEEWLIDGGPEKGLIRHRPLDDGPAYRTFHPITGQPLYGEYWVDGKKRGFEVYRDYPLNEPG